MGRSKAEYVCIEANTRSTVTESIEMIKFFKGDENFKPVWNSLDGKVDRRSFTGNYDLDSERRPLNPYGRTGIVGRGLLGRWGPNHAADPIVTKWKRTTDKLIAQRDGK